METAWKEQLLERIRHRKARIGVLGLGYVGLPLAVAFAEEGFSVFGIDVDAQRVEAIERGESYIPDVSSSRLQGLPLRATTDSSILAQSDVALICVPTPLSKTRDPDLSYILSAVEAVAKHLHPGMLVVLESTTYPGTTEELLLPRFEAQRWGEEPLQVGRHFFLAFSPERIDPGNRHYTLRNTPKVVAGVTPACLEVTRALYSTVVEHLVPVSSPATAEMVKLLENTFRAVNVALVNEVALMCEKLGLDVWEVIEAASTKPYGFMRFEPGPGLGGHCIPVDPHYLAWKLKLLDYNARFIQLASEINTSMPNHVVHKIVDALNEEGKPVKGSRLLVLGVAYKRDVNDTRESPALDIIRLLQRRGAQVLYHDPYVPRLPLDGALLPCATLSPSLLSEMDAVVIVTDHSSYHWEEILHHARLVVDTRNATRGLRGSAKVVRL